MTSDYLGSEAGAMWKRDEEILEIWEKHPEKILESSEN